MSRFQPYPWQVAPWRDKSPILLLDGGSGSGKSRLAGEKIHAYCLKYPGVTGIVGRKDRASASKSVVPLLRFAVQGDTSWGVYRKTDQLFEYNNESRIYVVGLKDENQLEALKSITGKHGDPDFAWFEEANALSLTDHETIQTRIRGTCGPWHQVIYTTNPDAPEHWINKLLIEGGQATRYFSLITDNPSASQRYIDILNNLTGVRKQKYRYGKWVRAEGVIYKDYDSSKHLIDLYNLKIDRTGRFVVGIDFGYTNPFAASLWYIDYNNRMYQIREMIEGYPIEAWITDHDAEDRATLENALGITTTAAYKSVKDGIEAVMQRYKDNKLFHCRGALMEEDLSLKDEHKPACTYEEIPGYRWSDKKQDTPVKENDHGMDMTRYVTCYIDRIGDSTTPIDAKKSVEISNYAR